MFDGTHLDTRSRRRRLVVAVVAIAAAGVAVAAFPRPHPTASTFSGTATLESIEAQGPRPDLSALPAVGTTFPVEGTLRCNPEGVCTLAADLALEGLANSSWRGTIDVVRDGEHYTGVHQMPDAEPTGCAHALPTYRADLTVERSDIRGTIAATVVGDSPCDIGPMWYVSFRGQVMPTKV